MSLSKIFLLIKTNNKNLMDGNTKTDIYSLVIHI